MTHEQFNNLVDSLEEIRINTLKTKNSKYAPEDDALHNFHAGAEIMGVTVQECIWGYMTKHLVALRDKILRNDWEDKDDALEKIQDIQNYLSFLWASINENLTHKENADFDYDLKEPEFDCGNCYFYYLSDDDNNWDESGMALNVEPCKNCKNNIPPIDERYKTAEIFFKES